MCHCNCVASREGVVAFVFSQTVALATLATIAFREALTKSILFRKGTESEFPLAPPRAGGLLQASGPQEPRATPGCRVCR